MYIENLPVCENRGRAFLYHMESPTRRILICAVSDFIEKKAKRMYNENVKGYEIICLRKQDRKAEVQNHGNVSESGKQWI